MRKAKRRDLLVMRLPQGPARPACSRTNRFCAAPVLVCREHLASSAGAIRALVVNTGNANAGTGAEGLANARRSCDEVARLLGCDAPAGAAVLDRRDPRAPAGGAPRCRASARAVAGLGASNWLDAAEAIMTTDTLPKGVSREIDVGGKRVVVTGIAKGVGHDPAEHGDDARFRRHRRGAAAGLARALGARGRRPRSIGSPSTATPRPTTRSC